MKISIITLFPQVLEPLLNFSILKRAQEKRLVEFELIDLRQFGEGIHKTVDDRPYGGGVGMVLKASVLAKVVKSLIVDRKSEDKKLYTTNDKPLTLLTSASGKTFNQQLAKDLSKEQYLMIIAGHYEGVDQRFIDKYVDMEISIGDYILTGGELPALVIADSVTRLIKGVLEKEEATKEESFENGLLEYPHYTRPEVFEGEKVPEVLLSGNHQEIAKWRKKQALEKTKKVKPDLLKRI